VASGTFGPTQPDHCVIALKRLAVSTSTAPNRNPSLTSLTLGGASLTGASARFTPGGPATSIAAARCTDASCAEIEPNGDYEQLLVSWFATDGSFDASRSLFGADANGDCTGPCLHDPPPPSVMTSWTPPAPGDGGASGAVSFWAVIRDDRGGVGWLAGAATQQIAAAMQ